MGKKTSKTKKEHHLPPVDEVFSQYILNDIQNWDEVAQLGKSNIRKLLELLDLENRGKLAKKEYQKVLDYLKSLEENSSEKPYLLSLLPYDYFGEGDEVLVYLGNIDPNEKLLKEDWVPAKVVQGYRHQDGFVNYETEIPVYNNLEYAEGKRGFSSISLPEVLKKSDFEALKEAAKSDPSFFEIWFKSYNYWGSFDLKKIILALCEGTIVPV